MSLLVVLNGHLNIFLPGDLRVCDFYPDICGVNRSAWGQRK